MVREARVRRETKETIVEVHVFLDGEGKVTSSTGVEFLDHMIETLLFYMSADGEVKAEYRGHRIVHHIVEDVGLVLGEAIRKAVGDEPVARFGWAIVPMDDALVIAAFDYSGRPSATVNLGVTGHVEDVDVTLIKHFIEALAWRMNATIHIYRLAGYNIHHIVEAAFKALGIAMKDALKPIQSIKSLKGTYT